MSSTDGGIIGAADPPDGVTPNFTNPDSIAYRLIIVAAFFPVLSLIFLSIRLWVAAFVIKRWHFDDFWISLAFTFAIANSIICIVQTRYGLGIHMWDVPADKFLMFMKLGMIAGHLTYNLTTLWIKISILSFYLRFSVERAFRIAVYVVMFVTAGYTLPNAFLFLYICRPMQSYWDFSVPGTCVNINAAFHTANALNVVTDFAILLLPIWMLKPLRAPLMKKIGILLILMAGGFVCAVSAMRMITALIGIYDPDLSWHYVVNLVWCLVEMYVGIICACLPCLRAFVKRYFPNMFVFDEAFEQRLTSFRISIPLTQLSPNANANANANISASGEEATAFTDSHGNLHTKPSKDSDFHVAASHRSEVTLHNQETK